MHLANGEEENEEDDNKQTHSPSSRAGALRNATQCNAGHCDWLILILLSHTLVMVMGSGMVRSNTLCSSNSPLKPPKCVFHERVSERERWKRIAIQTSMRSRTMVLLVCNGPSPLKLLVRWRHIIVVVGAMFPHLYREVARKPSIDSVHVCAREREKWI